MKLLRAFLLIALCAVVSACGSKFKTYDGPEVTRILVYKESRTMYLMHRDTPLRGFAIDRGFQPVDHGAEMGPGRGGKADEQGEAKSLAVNGFPVHGFLLGRFR